MSNVYVGNLAVSKISRNKRPYGVSDISNVSGINGGNDKTCHYEQAIPAGIWEVAHNLGKFPSVTITDNYGYEYEAQVNHIDANNLIITFSAVFAGYADLN